MSQPAVNLDDLHDAIKSALADQFTDCTVDFYPRPGERITTPAILLEIEDIAAQDPDEIGTEQLAVNINVNAYAVLDYKAGKKKAVKSFAASIMAFTRGKRWGEPVGPAAVAGAFPDVIAGKEDDYEVMRVEWSHEALLGLDIWRLDQVDDEGEPLPVAEEVYVASGTDVGTPDEPIKIAPCGCSET